MDAEFLDKKIEKDFYSDLPGFVCESLDGIIRKYGDQPWFLEAWNEYRNHVLESNIDDMKMPGFVFKKYIDNKIEHSDLFANEEYTIGDLMHYGIKRRSGRYPWGSGEDPFQHSPDFYSRVNDYKKAGLTEKEICDAEGLNTKEFRMAYSIAKDRTKMDKIAYAKSALADGKTKIQIAKELSEKYGEHIGDTTVGSLLNSDREAKLHISMKTADSLKDMVDKSRAGYLMVGRGSEKAIGVSADKMDTALYILETAGYHIYDIRVPQAGQKGQGTIVQLLAKPDAPRPKQEDFDKIDRIADKHKSYDGETFKEAFHYPASLDSKRLQIRYAEDGGIDKDGVVEIRRGVKDLSLGESNYAQVRILVDGTHYIKGMAVYSDGSDMPDGVDLIFNTNKSKSVSKMDVLKKIKDDPNNPFGSAIKEGTGPGGGQSYYIGDDGKEHLSLINKRSDAGDWGQWSKELSSQFLSKQPKALIKRQLNLSENEKESEFESIMQINNPTIKKKMLEEFADKCDKAAVELKAAHLPRQKYQVILPLTTIKDTEVYAPNYKDGETVILVRYPHGGTFEIPTLTVNNRLQEGKDIIGTSGNIDAVGISKAVADRLSGADFDGDTVMVIPLSGKFKVSTTDPLPGLVGFDPKLSYGPDPVESKAESERLGEQVYVRNGVRYKLMTDTQKQMGIVSNLITDMTLQGASPDELARAVRHSMVVIDAEKHKLDYKQSEIDNGIDALKKKYQPRRIDSLTGEETGGAFTLISKSKSDYRVPMRKPGAPFAKDTGNLLTLIDSEKGLYVDESTGKIYGDKEKVILKADPKTGKKAYRLTGEMKTEVSYTDSTGKKQKARVYEKNGDLYYKNNEGNYVKVTTEITKSSPILMKSTKMMEAEDAHVLSSGTIQEEIYADYANYMKDLGNRSRKEALAIHEIAYNPSARKVYAEQVQDLNTKLDEAVLNAPRENQAQLIVASQMKAIETENPRMTDEEKRKRSTQLLARARASVGAKRKEIYITDKEWEAIQAGAVTKNKLLEIIKTADKKRLSQLSMPRDYRGLSKAQVSRLKSLSNKGYSNSEIAEYLGISETTVINYLTGKETA